MSFKKKLIEVALPLEAINEEASLRKRKAPAGYPTTLHKWWAQRPLAACRAVIFASLVDDPSARSDKFPTEEMQEVERQRLFRLIQDLVKWENSGNERVLTAAREEILASTNGSPPTLYDPFAGGGSIPLEGQRLGLEVRASDLNPVAVLVTKALVEFPQRFFAIPPVSSESGLRKQLGILKRGIGMAEDVRYYGRWMRDEAHRRIGHFYPKADLPKSHGGGEASVVAWLWARTVRCPSPACRAMTPLVRSFALSTKKNNKAHIEPVIERLTKPEPDGSTVRVRFDVKHSGAVPQATVNRLGARCLGCGSPIRLDYIREEGRSNRMGVQLVATVAQTRAGRIYLPPTEKQERIAKDAIPAWKPDSELPEQALGFRVQAYGMTKHSDLYTSRQLLALTTLSDLVEGARNVALRDALDAGLRADGISLEAGGKGAQAYADAIATYLAFALSRSADYGSTIATWRPKDNAMRSTMPRQAVQMSWDFAEGSPFGTSSAGFSECVDVVAKVLERSVSGSQATVWQQDAQRTFSDVEKKGLVCTDPPYYDNIGYADLSDFFYSWLRPTLKRTFPSLMGTMQVPKSEELVATPYRFGGDRAAARLFFQEGLEKAFKQMRVVQDPAYPLSVFYAFKQAESEEEGEDETSTESHASTGWETMLEGLIRAGFSVHGTWPMRTEGDNRQVGVGTNALASSIVLVCRLRPSDAGMQSRRDFLTELRRELPEMLRHLQKGNIAPVDLAQASIGPGMAVFSRYAKVLESDGSAMTVRTALTLINQALDEVLAEQEGDFDRETRWALAWFDQYGFADGPYGAAETLCTAKNTSVPALVEAGILVAKGGKVRLCAAFELRQDWKPDHDSRPTVWRIVHQLVRSLSADGEGATGLLVAGLGARADAARELAYLLFRVCERKKRAQEALGYNALVQSWSQITHLAQSRDPTSSQAELL